MAAEIEPEVSCLTGVSHMRFRLKATQKCTFVCVGRVYTTNTGQPQSFFALLEFAKEVV